MPETSNPLPQIVAEMLGLAQYEIATLRARVIALKETGAARDALLLEKDQTIAALGERVAALEADNAHLKEI